MYFQVTGNDFHLRVTTCYVTIRKCLLNCSAQTHSAEIKAFFPPDSYSLLLSVGHILVQSRDRI